MAPKLSEEWHAFYPPGACTGLSVIIVDCNCYREVICEEPVQARQCLNLAEPDI